MSFFLFGEYAPYYLLIHCFTEFSKNSVEEDYYFFFLETIFLSKFCVSV